MGDNARLRDPGRAKRSVSVFDSPTTWGNSPDFTLGMYTAGGGLLSQYQTWQDGTFQMGAPPRPLTGWSTSPPIRG